MGGHAPPHPPPASVGLLIVSERRRRDRGSKFAQWASGRSPQVKAGRSPSEASHSLTGIRPGWAAGKGRSRTGNGRKSAAGKSGRRRGGGDGKGELLREQCSGALTVPRNYWLATKNKLRVVPNSGGTVLEDLSVFLSNRCLSVCLIHVLPVCARTVRLAKCRAVFQKLFC